jgi:hypothetical protein
MPKTGNIRFRVLGAVTDLTCGDATGYQRNLTAPGCPLLFSIDI